MVLGALCGWVLLFGQNHVVRVAAAASLTNAFAEIGREYEKANPGCQVQFSFAGSQTLATQIRNGAPFDVFASASEEVLLTAPIDKNTIRIFATNKPVVAIRADYRGPISFRDLSKFPRLAFAMPSVPVGRYSEQVLSNAAKEYGASWLKEVQKHTVSQEMDVRSVLTKVSLGEADAGIVYASDILAAPKRVKVVKIPESMNVVARYPVAVTTQAPNRQAAQSFVRFVQSRKAKRILVQNGFLE